MNENDKKDNIFLTQFSASFDSKKPKWKLTQTNSIIGHVSGRGAELGIGLDDLVNGLQEVFLCSNLPASSDGEHARFCAHTADLSAWQETHNIRFCLQNAFQEEQEILCRGSVVYVTIPSIFLRCLGFRAVWWYNSKKIRKLELHLTTSAHSVSKTFIDMVCFYTKLRYNLFDVVKQP